MNQPPFEAFAGDQPFIFISYAHLDADLVFPIISAWHNQGYRIWYDEGIDPGNEWPEEIANALEGCSQFLVFISPRSVLSKNVKNEINFALDMDKEFIAIHLEKTDLPSGLRLRMGDIQAIMKYRMPETMFNNKMNRALMTAALDALVVNGVPDGNKPEPAEAVPEVEKPVSPASMDDPEPEHPIIPERAEEDAVMPELSAGEAAESVSRAGKEPSPSSPWSGFRYKNIVNMTPTEIKEAVIEDIKLVREEAATLFKNEMENLKSSGAKKREKRATRRRQSAEKKQKELELKRATKELLQENSELTDEIRREIRSSLKKDRYKKRSGCLPRAPLILIAIVVAGYFIFFSNSYNSLTDTFLETNCPSVYSQEKKFELISLYDDTLKRRQKKWALEEGIRKCEAATDKSVREKELGLNTMTVDELETLLMSRIATSKKPNHLMLRKFMETRVRQKMEGMNPDARVFLEGFVGERYRNILIQMLINTADLPPQLEKKPVQSKPPFSEARPKNGKTPTAPVQ